MTVRLRIFLPLLLALLAVSALGESKAGASKTRFDVRGKINLAPDRPRPKTLEWATVLLESADGALQRQTTAEYNGRFHFNKVSEGRYQIVVYVRGFRATRRTVEVTRSFADPQGKVSVTIDLSEQDRITGRERARRRVVRVDALVPVPEKARKEYDRARQAMLKGDTDEMRRHLEKAIELAPNFVQALNDLGTYYHRTRHFDKAVELFRQALKANPDAFAPQVNLGGSLISAGKFAEAVTANRRALEMRPEDALANAQMGIALFWLEDYAAAGPYLEKAKAVDPSASTYPQIFLAEIHLKSGDPDRAARVLEEFLAQHPDSPDAPDVRRRIAAIKKP